MSAFLVKLEDQPIRPARSEARCWRWPRRISAIRCRFIPGERLEGAGAPLPHRHINDSSERTVHARRFGQSYRIQLRDVGDYLDLKVETKDGVLRLMIPRKRIIASNVDVFILWMVGSSLVLLAVAILFLRNQVRPIERLARAAEAFGKGRAVPDFKPYGATEVRRAAQAFITMRERIERYVQQRTEMLAGVSHDLKTPLTRLKLQLAMMKRCRHRGDARRRRRDGAHARRISRFRARRRRRGSRACRSRRHRRTRPRLRRRAPNRGHRSHHGRCRDPAFASR